MSNELQTAIEATKVGAKHALSYIDRDGLVVNRKKDDSPVTKVDKECEKIIKSVILKSFPKAQFVGEESGGNIDQDEFWIIDPIDGTKAYIRNIPFWAILIALYKNGTVQLGVSFVPGQNQLLYAEKGEGAFLNDKKVSVSHRASLERSYLTYTSPKRMQKQNTGDLFSLIDRVEYARSIGDAMSFHLLASGEIDIHVEVGLSLWDIAPFKVIIEEAGGKITDHKGSPWTRKTTDILASNGILHDEVIRILNQ